MKTINDIIENVNEGKDIFNYDCIYLRRLGLSEKGCLYLQDLIYKGNKSDTISASELAKMLIYVFESLNEK